MLNIEILKNKVRERNHKYTSLSKTRVMIKPNKKVEIASNVITEII